MPSSPSLWSLLKEHWYLAGHLRSLAIHLDQDACTGCGLCLQVCPRGCWDIPEGLEQAVYLPGRCIACGACVLQCPPEAISLT